MRKNYFDIARGIGILLVVLGHSLEIYLGAGSVETGRAGVFTIWKFIYSFHMPLFFLLSGGVMTRLAGTAFRKALAGALYLLVIATILQLLAAPLRLVLPQPGDPLHSSLSGAVGSAVWPAVKLESYALVAIWFLPCLALARLAVWVVANTSRTTGAAFLLVLGLLCIGEHALGVGYFQLRSLIVGVAWFGIGQRIGALELDRMGRGAGWAGFAAGLLLTVLTFDDNHGCTFSAAQACPGPRYGGFAVLMVSGAFGFLPLFAVTALAGSGAVLAASLLLDHARAGRWLALVGRRTLEILIVNAVALVFVQPWLAPYVAAQPKLLVVVALGAAQLAGALVLSPILNRFLGAAREVAERIASACTRPLPPPAHILYAGSDSEERR